MSLRDSQHCSKYEYVTYNLRERLIIPRANVKQGDNTTSPPRGVPWEAFQCLLTRLWMDWQRQTSPLFCLVINEL